MLYLIASCIALLFGPVFYRFFSTGSGLQKGLDGFIFVSLGGLVLIHILPELLEHGGFVTILFVILGLWGPSASERIFHRHSELTHNITLSLGIGGLLLHTITDGGAMVLSQQQDQSPLLALGVILHRLPVGLAIWWLLKPQVGTKWASAVLAAMMVLTGVGYFAGEQLIHQLSIENTVYLQAFVTGSILHVVLHQPHGEHIADKQGKFEYHAGVGSLLGLILLAILMAMDPPHEHQHVHHGADQFVHWLLAISPALVLSYFVAAVRFKLGLTPNSQNSGSLWLQRLAGPEAIVVTILLLGPWFALYQVIGLLILGLLLSFSKVELAEPTKPTSDSALRFGLASRVDRSAPWILLSLVLANLIGHPSVPLENPALQVFILMLILVPMRFCALGATILAVALHFSGWDQVAVAFCLLAAPVINIAQLKKMSWQQIFMLAATLLGAFIVADTVSLNSSHTLALPSMINMMSLVIIGLIFGASLLRLGPRKFLNQMFTHLQSEPKHTHHKHEHHHHSDHH